MKSLLYLVLSVAAAAGGIAIALELQPADEVVDLDTAAEGDHSTLPATTDSDTGSGSAESDGSTTITTTTAPPTSHDDKPEAALDSDGDGVADEKDKCSADGKGSPDGCPDSDDDGVSYDKDQCPTVSGQGAPSGCRDEDGDGIEYLYDACADQDGKGSPDGCPDSDDDRINFQEDDCPTENGDGSPDGCPDSDGDSMSYSQDRCPDEAGPDWNDGCAAAQLEIEFLDRGCVIQRDQFGGEITDFNVGFSAKLRRADGSPVKHFSVWTEGLDRLDDSLSSASGGYTEGETIRIGHGFKNKAAGQSGRVEVRSGKVLGYLNLRLPQLDRITDKPTDLDCSFTPA